MNDSEQEIKPGEWIWIACASGSFLKIEMAFIYSDAI